MNSGDESNGGENFPRRLALVECSAPIWASAVADLEKHAVEVVFWAGRKDFVHDLRTRHPKCNFLSSGEARKGAQLQIPDKSPNLGLSRECEQIWRESSSLIFRQMDRLDHYSRDMTTEEKYLLLYEYFDLATSIIDGLEPDLVVFPVPPHAGWDFTLYLLCKKVGVRTLVFDNVTIVPPFMNVMGQTPLSVPGPAIGTWPSKPSNLGSLPKGAPEDYQVFEQFSQESDQVIPETEKRIHETGFQARANFAIASGWKASSFALRSFLFPRALDRLFKQRGKKLGDSYTGRFWGVQLSMEKLRYLLLARRLASYYENRCTALAGVSGPYLYFPLSFQPERSSNPIAGEFENLLLTVSRVAREISPDLTLLVREHPSMLHPSREGTLYRSKEFYDKVLSLQNVRLISTKEKNFELIDKSRGIITLSGTSALEGVSRGIPAIVLSNMWFADLPGVQRLDPNETLAELPRLLENLFPVSIDEMAKYFRFIREHSIPVFTDSPWGEFSTLPDSGSLLSACVLQYLDVNPGSAEGAR